MLKNDMGVTKNWKKNVCGNLVLVYAPIARWAWAWRHVRLER